MYLIPYDLKRDTPGVVLAYVIFWDSKYTISTVLQGNNYCELA